MSDASEEVSSVKQIYCDAVTVEFVGGKNKDNNLFVLTIGLPVQSVSQDNNLPTACTGTLEITIPMGYPIKNALILNFKATSGLSDERAKNLLKKITEECEKRIGENVLFDMIENARDLFVKESIPSLPCPACFSNFHSMDALHVLTGCSHVLHAYCYKRVIHHTREVTAELRANMLPHLKLMQPPLEQMPIPCPICKVPSAPPTDLDTGDKWTNIPVYWSEEEDEDAAAPEPPAAVRNPSPDSTEFAKLPPGLKVPANPSPYPAVSGLVVSSGDSNPPGDISNHQAWKDEMYMSQLAKGGIINQPSLMRDVGGPSQIRSPHSLHCVGNVDNQQRYAPQTNCSLGHPTMSNFDSQGFTAVPGMGRGRVRDSDSDDVQRRSPRFATGNNPYPGCGDLGISTQTTGYYDCDYSRHNGTSVGGTLGNIGGVGGFSRHLDCHLDNEAILPTTFHNNPQTMPIMNGQPNVYSVSCPTNQLSNEMNFAGTSPTTLNGPLNSGLFQPADYGYHGNGVSVDVGSSNDPLDNNLNRDHPRHWSILETRRREAQMQSGGIHASIGELDRFTPTPPFACRASNEMMQHIVNNNYTPESDTSSGINPKVNALFQQVGSSSLEDGFVTGVPKISEDQNECAGYDSSEFVLSTGGTSGEMSDSILAVSVGTNFGRDDSSDFVGFSSDSGINSESVHTYSNEDAVPRNQSVDVVAREASKSMAPEGRNEMPVTEPWRTSDDAFSPGGIKSEPFGGSNAGAVLRPMGRGRSHRIAVGTPSWPDDGSKKSDQNVDHVDLTAGCNLDHKSVTALPAPNDEDTNYCFVKNDNFVTKNAFSDSNDSHVKDVSGFAANCDSNCSNPNGRNIAANMSSLGNNNNIIYPTDSKSSGETNSSDSRNSTKEPNLNQGRSSQRGYESDRDRNVAGSPSQMYRKSVSSNATIGGPLTANVSEKSSNVRDGNRPPSWGNGGRSNDNHGHTIEQHRTDFGGNQKSDLPFSNRNPHRRSPRGRNDRDRRQDAPRGSGVSKYPLLDLGRNMYRRNGTSEEVGRTNTATRGNCLQNDRGSGQGGERPDDRTAAVANVNPRDADRRPDQCDSMGRPPHQIHPMGRTLDQGDPMGRTPNQSNPVSRPPNHGYTKGVSPNQANSIGRPRSQGESTVRPPHQSDPMGRAPNQGNTMGRQSNQGVPMARSRNHSGTMGRPPNHGDPTGHLPNHGDTIGRSANEEVPIGRPHNQEGPMGRPNQDKISGRPPNPGEPMGRPPNQSNSVRRPFNQGGPMRPPSQGNPSRPPNQGDPIARPLFQGPLNQNNPVGHDGSRAEKRNFVPNSKAVYVPISSNSISNSANLNVSDRLLAGCDNSVAQPTANQTSTRFQNSPDFNFSEIINGTSCVNGIGPKPIYTDPTNQAHINRGMEQQSSNPSYSERGNKFSNDKRAQPRDFNDKRSNPRGGFNEGRGNRVPHNQYKAAAPTGGFKNSNYASDKINDNRLNIGRSTVAERFAKVAPQIPASKNEAYIQKGDPNDNSLSVNQNKSVNVKIPCSTESLKAENNNNSSNAYKKNNNDNNCSDNKIAPDRQMSVPRGKSYFEHDDRVGSSTRIVVNSARFDAKNRSSTDRSRRKNGRRW